MGKCKGGFIVGRQAPESHWIIIDRLSDIILENVKGSIVEIGMGGSTRVLSRHSAKFKRKYYSCDTSKRLCDWFKENLPNPNHTIFCGKSMGFIDQFDCSPVALVFLDGRHKYDIVKQEFEFFLPLLSCGGVMFLHDAAPSEQYTKRKGHTIGVELLRKELELLDSIYTFVWPYTAGDMGLMMITKKKCEVK